MLLKPTLFFLLFIGTSNLGLAQTIIHLKQDTTKYFSSYNGIYWYADENQSHIAIKTKQQKGMYTIFSDERLIAKVNYISSKEYLIYEYHCHDSTKIKIIYYYPYFKVAITDTDSIKTITLIETYKDDLVIYPQLLKHCYFKLFIPSTPFRKYQIIHIYDLLISNDPPEVYPYEE